jgi:signal transduction histidine kinase
MQPVLIELNHFMTEVIERLQITSTSHQLCLQLPASPVWVKVDVERLEQVINNLVNNAIKYSPAAQKVVIAVADDQDKVNLQVEDYGKGISPQELPYIFDRFYRSPSVKNSTMQGLGLGLYICHEIIKASNGEITVTSTLNAGSTFTVTLPKVSSEVKFNPVPLEQSAS